MYLSSAIPFFTSTINGFVRNATISFVIANFRRSVIPFEIPHKIQLKILLFLVHIIYKINKNTQICICLLFAQEMSKNFLLFLFFMFICINSFAQLGPPGHGGPPVEAPIDGGILYLLGAALSYGIYHFKHIKNKLRSDK